MIRKYAAGTLVVLLAIITLIFGDNLFQQITGRSAFSARQPVTTPILVVLATTIPTVAVEQSPTLPLIPTETLPPTATQSPTDTRPQIATTEPTVMVSSEPIVVSGIDGDGWVWSVPTTGRYHITYDGGAYSPWPDNVGCDPAGCWKTTILVYRNRDVVWLPSGNMEQPGEPDWRIGDDTWQQTPELAVERANLSNGIVVDLQANEYLIFIAVDGRDPNTGFSAYSQGQDYENGVQLEVSYVSQ